jgi:hypothetical protein
MLKKLSDRVQSLEDMLSEPVMDDFDSGLRAGHREELEFLQKVLREYGEPKKG